MSRVRVVVVAYRSADRLRASISPLLAAGISVTVVDNASPDDSGTVARELGADVLELGANRGFAAGCNAGWKATDEPFVLFLNPDAVIDSDAVGRLVDVLAARPGTAVAAPKILDEDGRLQYSQRRFPKASSTFSRALFLHRVFPHASWSDELVRDEAAYAVDGSPDWVSGACMLVRRAALEEVGGWDDGFFMYAEDADLCKRLRDAGYDIRFVSGAVVRHEGGASAPRPSLAPVLVRSRVRYASKHGGRRAAVIERTGVAIEAAGGLITGRGGPHTRRGHARALAAALRRRA